MVKNSNQIGSVQVLPYMFFWSFSFLMAVIFLMHPDIIASAEASGLINSNDSLTYNQLTNPPEDGHPENLSFGGAELGDATWVLFNTLSEIVFPFAAIAAGVFGLFALVRGFNVAVIGGAFAVAIVAGLMPNLLLRFSGYANPIIF